ncbi:MAG: hypothetical protein Kow00108_10450 [Calditrichia bacterium]
MVKKSGQLSRSFDREWVFKIAYASMINGDSVEKNYDILKDYNRFRLSDFGKLYLRIMNEYLNSEELVQPLKENIEKVEFEVLSSMARVLMQMAVAEMKFIVDTPPEISLNEVLNLAKLYVDDQEKRLINSVLDKTFKSLKEADQLNIGYFK